MTELISIIIPCFNEEATIQQFVEEMSKVETEFE